MNRRKRGPGYLEEGEEAVTGALRQLLRVVGGCVSLAGTRREVDLMELRGAIDSGAVLAVQPQKADARRCLLVSEGEMIQRRWWLIPRSGGLLVSVQ